MIDLKKLRELAMAVDRKGKWEAVDPSPQKSADYAHNVHVFVDGRQMVLHWRPLAQFIAAANPAAILELLNMLEKPDLKMVLGYEAGHVDGFREGVEAAIRIAQKAGLENADGAEIVWQLRALLEPKAGES